MSDDKSPSSDIPLGAELREHALALYGRAEVATACLDLQDRFGADVNIVLWCCWLGCHGARVDTASLVKADRAVAPWRDTAVAPLRSLRRRLKTDVGGITPAKAAAFRETVKAAEIEAELLELDHLRVLAEHLPATDGRAADRVGVTRGNLLRYMGLLGVAPETMPRDALEGLARASVEH